MRSLLLSALLTLGVSPARALIRQRTAPARDCAALRGQIAAWMRRNFQDKATRNPQVYQLFADFTSLKQSARGAESSPARCDAEYPRLAAQYGELKSRARFEHAERGIRGKIRALPSLYDGSLFNGVGLASDVRPGPGSGPMNVVCVNPSLRIYKVSPAPPRPLIRWTGDSLAGMVNWPAAKALVANLFRGVKNSFDGSHDCLAYVARGWERTHNYLPRGWWPSGVAQDNAADLFHWIAQNPWARNVLHRLNFAVIRSREGLQKAMSLAGTTLVYDRGWYADNTGGHIEVVAQNTPRSTRRVPTVFDYRDLRSRGMVDELARRRMVVALVRVRTGTDPLAIARLERGAALGGGETLASAGLPRLSGGQPSWLPRFVYERLRRSNVGMKLARVRTIAENFVSIALGAGVDPYLAAALIETESSFDTKARSGVGAEGLAQLMPGTARSLGVSDPLHQAQSNLAGGLRYLRGLLDRFMGDQRLALAAYNAGPHRAQMPQESLNYADHILSRAQEFRRAAAGKGA